MTEHIPSKPRPGDFEVGSAESRAAARAVLQELAAKDGPQPGDVHLDWSDRPHAPEERAGLETLYRVSIAGKKDKRIPGIPVFWITLPSWFVVPKVT